MKTSIDNIASEIVEIRLAPDQSGVDEAAPDDQAHLYQIFHQRAHRLSQRGRVDTVPTARSPVLIIRTGTERFGIELSHVAHVVSHISITPIPGSGNHFAGVANLGGKICSVIDLGGLVGLVSGNPAGEFVILIRANNASVGLRAEAVDEVRGVELDKLSPIDNSLAGELSSLVKGVTKDRISVLDSAELLALIRNKCSFPKPGGDA